MRRYVTGWVVALAAALVPLWGFAGNQEFAEQIAKGLRDSGQLQDYKIGVKYQDGTAWLRGTVTSEEQMQKALSLAGNVEGVSHVINNLTVAPGEAKAAVPAPAPAAQRVASSFTPTPVRPVTATEATPTPAMAPPAPAPRPTGTPMPISYRQQAPCPTCPVPAGADGAMAGGGAVSGAPLSMGGPVPAAMGPAPARFDQPQLPNYAWPSYAAYPNYAAVTYPRQYSPTAWPYIGPFYPYPQVPLGWRKVTLEWDDGWWFLDFKDHH